VPAVNDSGGGGSRGRRGSGYRSLPLWLQWVLPFAVAGGLVLALVLFVNYETNSVPAIALVTNPNAVKEENREDTILVHDQQAPHEAKLKASASPTVALRTAVVGYMTHQISLGSMDGPIKRSSCRSATGGTSSRLVFHCDVTASAQMVTYPFDAVVQPSSGVITYCQRVAPPIPRMNVPVSKRCT
jgi:hypothetical protein